MAFLYRALSGPQKCPARDSSVVIPAATPKKAHRDPHDPHPAQWPGMHRPHPPPLPNPNHHDRRTFFPEPWFYGALGFPPIAIILRPC